MRKLVLILAAMTLLSPAARAAGVPNGDGALCDAAIRAAERGSELPDKLLGAIAAVESGRRDPLTGRWAPWPWTINVQGQGRYFASKAEAVAATEALLAAGTRSVDVGCMQINLFHHPAAFPSLDQAFEPQANAAYAVRFLTQLYRQSSNWPKAAGSYHSQTPDFAADYQRRLAGALSANPRLALQMQPAAAPSDPGVYTAEFARVLAQDAARRAGRGLAAAEPGRSRSLLALARPERIYTREFLAAMAQDDQLRGTRLSGLRGERGSPLQPRLARRAPPLRVALGTPG